MKEYECEPCGYIYDPELGDPDGGIEPGTPFEEIPDDWICPVCGVGKEEFRPVDQSGSGSLDALGGRGGYSAAPLEE